MLELLLHGVGSYSAGGLIGPARWPHYDLIVIVEGAVEFSIDGSPVACEAGDAFLIPPRHSFQGEAGPGGATIWVQHFSCRGPASRKWLSLPAATARWSGVGQWEWPRTLMRRLSRLQNSSALPTADKAHGLLLALLLEEFMAARQIDSGESAGAQKIIHLVTDWVENHALPLPSLKEMAEYTGWSVSYFRDQFRLFSGRPVGDYLRQRRMEEAARLLDETRRPIKEIAAQAGYGDVAAFHRAFQDRYKMTPGQYRDRRVLMV